MKRRTYLILSCFAVLLMNPALSRGQADKKAAELKKLETALTAAKSNVTKYEKQVALADSLISGGTEMINTAKADNKNLTAERKKLDKDYASGRKAIEKLTTSKDKDVAAKARTDLKDFDTKYKADVKANDTKLRDAGKKLTTGNTSLSKGKTGKKTAEDGLKNAKTALEAAQKKYDDATGASQAVEGTKTKKK